MIKNKKLLSLVLAVAAAGVTALLLNGKGVSPSDSAVPGPFTPKHAVETYVAPRKFGLLIDSFNIIESTVQRNEFLSNILGRYGIENVTIANLAQKSKPIFDVRRITAGSYAATGTMV